MGGTEEYGGRMLVDFRRCMFGPNHGGFDTGIGRLEYSEHIPLQPCELWRHVILCLCI